MLLLGCRLIDRRGGNPAAALVKPKVKGKPVMAKFQGPFQFTYGNIGTKAAPVQGVRLKAGGDMGQESLPERLKAVVAAGKASDKIRVFDPDGKIAKGGIATLSVIKKALDADIGYIFVVMQGRAARPDPYLAFLKSGPAAESRGRRVAKANPLAGL